MDTALRTNHDIVLDRIVAACRQADRSPSEVTVVAITKTFPASYISNAYALGIRHFGENRVQEMLDKLGDGKVQRECHEATLHLVGHLQSNKVRKALQVASAVDSVDSFHLAQAIDRVADELGRAVRILIEVNTSGEPQKYGIPPNQVLSLAESILPLPSLRLAGFMTVGPNVDDEDSIRRSFAELRKRFQEVKEKLHPSHWSVLSMGMSGDYPIAIEEGATEIRLGTALFGTRSP
ncbi:YggS family pyridoxal phosphate-dependent enzyme [bacterium]|nr:YggS family pyridoxal phosphate-dependent enzyme [bacterium]MBU1985219.1 YggS family pyridoxal phosphate-dependent enzyme [bacterium]